MDNWKLVLSSLLIGVIYGAICIYIMGYVAAIAIPKEFFELLGSKLGYVTIGIINQFLAFGILAILTGYALGKMSSSRWLVSALSCFIGIQIYGSIGIAYIYDIDIIWPYSQMTLLLVPESLVMPICLFLSTYLTFKRYNQQFNLAPTAQIT